MCWISLFCPQYWSNLRNLVQTFHKVQNGAWFCLYPFHHLGQRTHLLDLSLEALHMLENDYSLCFLKDPLLIMSGSRQMHMGTKNLKIYCAYNYFIQLNSITFLTLAVQNWKKQIVAAKPLEVTLRLVKQGILKNPSLNLFYRKTTWLFKVWPPHKRIF